MRAAKSFFDTVSRAAFLAALLAALATPSAEAGDPLFAGYGSGARGVLDQAMKAKSVESLDLSFAIPNDFVDQILGQGAQTQVACVFEAKNGGLPQNGVKARASGTVSVGGIPVANLGPVRGRTGRDGTFGAVFNLPVPGPVGAPITVDATFDPSGNKRITNWHANCFGLVNQSP